MNIISKQIVLLVFSAIMAFQCNAIPACKGLHSIALPDGTELKVSIVGDEHFHYYLTEDGYPLLTEGDTFYYAAPADADCTTLRNSGIKAQNMADRSQQVISMLAKIDKRKVVDAMDAMGMRRRAAASRKNGPGLYARTTFPHMGNQKALVILVEYSDVKFKIDNPADYFSRMLNQPGFADYGGTGSALDFFMQNSGELFRPEFDLYGPVTLSQPMSAYGSNNASGYDRNPQNMVIEACELLDDQVNFAEYDRDGDGMIDNVFVFYAGLGENSGGLPTSVWPHSADIVDRDSTPHYFDNVQLNRYACTNEWKGNRPDGVGTFVHEFSHVLGLPDLYVTTETGNAFTPGTWSTLDYGPYNNNGCTPPNYSAFERYALGWLEPRVISGPCDIAIHDISTNEACIIPTGKENEYFLLENRQQKGWDAYIPGHGMLVWHVDYNERVWDRNSVNNSASHQYVDIEEADGIQSEYNRDGDCFPGAAGVTSFTDETTPSMKTWSGRSLNLPISDITESADGIVTMSVAGGRLCPGVTEVLDATEINPLGFTANWQEAAEADYYELTVAEDGAETPLLAYDAVNVGNVTSYSVENLKPETTYKYTVVAVNNRGRGAISAPMSICTPVATFEYKAPVALEGRAENNAFVARWNRFDEAEGYILDVYTKERGEAYTELIDFTDGLAGMPQDWTTDSHMTYSLKSYVGEAAPSLRLNDNELMSPIMSDDIHSISFWCRGNNAPAENMLLVSADNGTDEWVEVLRQQVDNATGGKTVSCLFPAGTRRVKISHYRPGGAGALAVDDVVMRWGGEFHSTPLSGYDKRDVGNVTEHTVTSLVPEATYYYCVTAYKGALWSLKSSEIAVTTGEDASLQVEEFISDSTHVEAGRECLYVFVAQPAELVVRDVAGRVIAASAIVAGDNTIDIPAGTYIVSVNEQIFKIIVK